MARPFVSLETLYFEFDPQTPIVIKIWTIIYTEETSIELRPPHQYVKLVGNFQFKRAK
jgi:hypothetical protein